MSVVDPSIPLSADPITIDPGRAFTLADMAQKMRAQQQQAQSQNALKQIFANPQNIDQTGGLTANALRQIMAVDPGTGMKYQEEQLRINEQKLKRADEIHGLIDPVRDSALNAYDEVLNSGGSQDAATAAGQRALDEGLSPLRTGGLLSQEEKAQLRSKFEYGPMKASALSYKERLVEGRAESGERRAEEELTLNKRTADRADAQLRIAQAAAGRAAQTFKETHEGLGLTKDPAALDEASRMLATTGKLPEGASLTDRKAALDNIAKMRAAGTLPISPKELSEPKEVEVNDPAGGTRQLLAQQDKNTGQWVSADEKRTPINADNIRIVKETSAGGRETVMNQRLLVDASDAVSEISNISELPMSASTGWLNLHGGPHGSIVDSVKTVLANGVTSQEVQDYKSSIGGLGRALGGLETGGLQVNKSLMESLNSNLLAENDTQFTKLRKMANMRQQVDNALEAFITNPRAGKAQIELAQKLRTKIDEAIPWMPHDVTMLERSTNKKETISDVAQKRGLSEAEKRGFARIKNPDDPNLAVKPLSLGQNTESAAPPASMLKKGTATKFSNGQVWTLGDDGKPQRMQ